MQMNTVDKITVLKKIAGEFNRAGIVWSLGASMLLYFKGIVADYHDIDILVMSEDVETVKEIMVRMQGKIQPLIPNEKYRSKAFLEYDVSGVEVDIIAGFAIMNGGQLFNCSLRADQIVEYVDLDGEKIPLQSVDLWRKYYELMGRKKKVQMINDFNERNRTNSACV
jgi:hypothetical protein